MIKLIKDFLLFRKLQDVAPEMGLPNDVKRYIEGNDFKKEQMISSFIIFELMKMMIKGEISHEFINGFKSALAFRATIVLNNKPKVK